jgi:hypothetical protein
MNGKRAKLLRRATKDNCPADWPDVNYKMINQQMTPMKMLDGSVFNVLTYTQTLVKCKRAFTQQLKKEVRKNGWDILYKEWTKTA